MNLSSDNPGAPRCWHEGTSELPHSSISFDFNHVAAFLMEQYDKSWVNMGHAHVFMYIYMYALLQLCIYIQWLHAHTHTNCTYIHTIHTYAHLEKRKTVTLLIIRVAPTYKKVNDSQTGVKLVSFPPFSEVHLSSYMRSASVKGDFGSLYLKALAVAEGPIGWAESHRKRLWIDSLRLLVVLAVFSCYFPPIVFRYFRFNHPILESCWQTCCHMRRLPAGYRGPHRAVYSAWGRGLWAGGIIGVLLCPHCRGCTGCTNKFNKNKDLISLTNEKVGFEQPNCIGLRANSGWKRCFLPLNHQIGLPVICSFNSGMVLWWRRQEGMRMHFITKIS